MTNHSTFQRIALFIRKDDPLMKAAIIKVYEFLKQRGLDIMINEPMQFLPDLAVISTSEFAERSDLTIAIGGDGTILSASRELAGTDLPIVGVNVGRLGFLADVTLSNLEQELTSVLEGQYRNDYRFMLQCTINNDPETVAIAMNDVVVHAHQSLNMIEFETSINGKFLNSQLADGLVTATPTGSTAYAMSAGGPIMDVDLDVIVLASVCPHTLSNRPLVISANSVLEITLSDHTISNAMLTCDGRPGRLLQPGDTIQISRHPDSVHLLHLEDHDHYSILRAKLGWGTKLI